MEAKAVSMATFTLLVTMLISSFVVFFTKGVDGAPVDSPNFIDKLPNQPSDVQFSQFAGYITINQSTEKKFFYYLSEAAMAKASSLPLMLWLSSGPGCSAFGSGAFRQVGPFRVNSDGKTLEKNPIHGMKMTKLRILTCYFPVANLLFVEMPAGVGFARSGKASDVTQQSDGVVVNDLYTFIVRWLQQFSDYTSRDLYIAGQAYAAGHFVPQLANLIAQQNKKAKPVINIKGVAMGNPNIDPTTELEGKFEDLWGRAFLSDATYELFKKECNPKDPSSPGCQTHLAGIMSTLRSLNPINAYSLPCPGVNASNIDLHNIQDALYGCQDQYIANYLNTRSVQQALHLDLSKGAELWTPCNRDVVNSWYNNTNSSLGEIHEVLAGNIRVLIYSGDMDLNTPTTSTKLAVKALGLKVVSKWQPWFTNDVEIGGERATYEGGLTFATVRNAGAYVAESEGLRALTMIRAFLANENFPNSRFYMYPDPF